jgi:hypothetical protein
MAPNIHAPVQDTDDINAIFHDETKYQVLAGRVNTQAVYVVPCLLHAPGRNGVIPDRIDIGSSPRS